MAGRRRIQPGVVRTLTGKCSRQGSALAVACRTLVLKFKNANEGCVTGMADFWLPILALSLQYRCTVATHLPVISRRSLYLKGPPLEVQPVGYAGNVGGLLGPRVALGGVPGHLAHKPRGRPRVQKVGHQLLRDGAAVGARTENMMPMALFTRL